MKYKPANRIDTHGNKGVKLDDLWQTDVDVHIEAMGDGNYHIGIYHADGHTIGLYGKSINVAWDDKPAVSTQSEETP